MLDQALKLNIAAWPCLKLQLPGYSLSYSNFANPLLITHFFGDNMFATFLEATPVFHASTKHIELDFRGRKLLKKKNVVRFLCSSDQISDALTKSLASKNSYSQGSLFTKHFFYSVGRFVFCLSFLVYFFLFEKPVLLSYASLKPSVFLQFSSIGKDQNSVGINGRKRIIFS